MREGLRFRGECRTTRWTAEEEVDVLAEGETGVNDQWRHGVHFCG